MASGEHPALAEDHNDWGHPVTIKDGGSMSDTDWKAKADQAIAHNVADVLENGPRLAWGRKTAEIAIDRKNMRILKTGLGCMGVGTTWIDYEEEQPEWADLPEEDSTPEDRPFGFRFIYTSAVPHNEILLIGSCGCLHAITEHHEHGCRSCPCDVPIGRLVVKIEGIGDE